MRVGGELLRPEWVAAPGPRMIGADDHGQFVVADDPAAQALRAGRAFDEAQVGRACLDLRGDGIAVSRGQQDLGRRLAAMPGRGLQGDEPSGQELLGNGQAGAHPQPHLVITPERGQPGIEFARDRKQPGGPFGDDHALGGEHRSAGRPGDERHTGPRFDRTDPGRHRLLGDAELPGGRAQAARARHREEHLQGGQVGNAITQRHHSTLARRHKQHLYPPPRGGHGEDPGGMVSPPRPPGLDDIAARPRPPPGPGAPGPPARAACRRDQRKASSASQLTVPAGACSSRARRVKRRSPIRWPAPAASRRRPDGAG